MDSYVNQRSYPNQDCVVIHHAAKFNQDNELYPYIRMRNDIVQEASRNLSGCGFKLWVYFHFYPELMELWYSPKDVVNKLGVSRRALDVAKNELLQYGYLVPIPGCSRKFHFFEDGIPFAPILRAPYEEEKEPSPEPLPQDDYEFAFEFQE